MFFTICALTRPSTSVRKSSGRSDQRSPPRATLAAAQVHAFEARRVDEDLEHRLRLGQARHLRRIELERQEACAAALARRGARNSCASSRGSARGTAAARGPRTGSRRLRARPRSRARCSAARAPAPAPPSGSKRALNSATSIARDVGVRGERRLDERLRQRKADLAHVLRIGAQHDDLGGGHARRDHQPVEVVVLDLAAEDAAERVLEHLRAARRPRRRRRRQRACMPKSCIHTGGRSVRRDPVRTLVEHLAGPCARASAGCRTASPARRGGRA